MLKQALRNLCYKIITSFKHLDFGIFQPCQLFPHLFLQSIHHVGNYTSQLFTQEAFLDEVAYTLSVKLVRSIELPMMAKITGSDGILIDMEYSSFDLDTTGTHQFIYPADMCTRLTIEQRVIYA